METPVNLSSSPQSSVLSCQGGVQARLPCASLVDPARPDEDIFGLVPHSKVIPVCASLIDQYMIGNGCGVSSAFSRHGVGLHFRGRARAGVRVRFRSRARPAIAIEIRMAAERLSARRRKRRRHISMQYLGRLDQVQRVLASNRGGAGAKRGVWWGRQARHFEVRLGGSDIAVDLGVGVGI